VRRRTFAGLTGISAIDALLPAPRAAQPPAGTEQLALILTTQAPGADREPPDLRVLTVQVRRARTRSPRTPTMSPLVSCSSAATWAWPTSRPTAA
jgi:hypothetical protein